jgi:peptidyl-prolyl cis-trans isomerase A (cyclophilin A)
MGGRGSSGRLRPLCGRCLYGDSRPLLPKALTVSKLGSRMCRRMRVNPSVQTLTLMLLITVAFGVEAGTHVQFRTSVGDLQVELFDEDQPATVQRFLKAVKEGTYRNTFFHRCSMNMLLAGGLYATSNRSDNVPVTEVHDIYFPGPTLERSSGVQKHSFGTLARTTLTGSMFFFNLRDNPDMDTLETFVVFGKVLDGTNTLNDFNRRTPTNGIASLAASGENLPVVPVLNSSTSPNYTDLIYVDISLLNVQVLRSNNTVRIAWNSISNKTNVVQFTTNFPPVWQTLSATNGTGERLEVKDDSTERAHRFYRIEVNL